jgi:hypothetical protein
MRLLIGNRSLNHDNIKPKKYSVRSSKGDNKKNLWILPKSNLKHYGFAYKNQEDLNLTDKNFDDYFSNFDCVIFFRTNTFIKKHYENIKKNKKFKKILYLDDLHTSPEINELRELDPAFYNLFDLILSSYEYTFKKFFPDCTVPVYWYPHFLNNKFKSIRYNTNPKNEILLSGCISKKVYPMRYNLALLRDKYPIEILGHPGYNKRTKHSTVGLRYNQYINKYRYGFTCCSYPETPYIVAKFFEIPGNGALLLAYDKYVKEPLQKLGFIDGENYISVDDDNLEEKMQYVLNEENISEIERIRENGFNLVRNNHMLTNRIDDLIVYLEKHMLI